jgi:hypothetical protein
MAKRPVTVNDLLVGQVGLDLECADRVYLNGYVPNLQAPGHIVGFLTRHLGNPIPSPALMDQIGQRFRQAVDSYAEANHIPVVRFGKGQRKVEVMRPMMRTAAATRRSQVVAIGIAQEYAWVSDAHTTRSESGAPWFTFGKAQRRVSAYYFYLWDAQMGGAFIKVCSYFPYPMKIWVNGHEWSKRQATAAGIGFTELSNGFASCDDPAGLQAICDRFGPQPIRDFVERWLDRLPLPLTAADRAAGFWWDLSMRQVEFSRTIVFTAPRHARTFLPDPHRRQPRPRPSRQHRNHLRPQDPPTGQAPVDPAVTAAGRHAAREVQDRHRPRQPGCDRQRVLQALPGQAVPQRRSGHADRDRRQRHHRSGRAAPPGTLRRTVGQGTCDQPPDRGS